LKFLSLLGRSRRTLPIVIVILCLLAGQAYCELMLPNYMSNVVNVGIMQGGVETAVPQEIRETTMQGLGMMMPKEDQQFVAGLYTADPARKGVLKLKPPGDLGSTKTEQENTMSRLDTVFTNAIVAAINAQGTMIPDQIDSMKTSAAVAFVQQEYKAIGLDMQVVQNAYMKPTAQNMILFASGSAVAAILVGLLASLTAAGIGRFLRRDSFAQIMSFSGVEMEHFSPASLITRSTNDIQQIQMTMTMFLRMVLYAPVMAVGGIIMVSRTDTGLSWIIVVAVVVLAAVIGTLLGITMPKFQRMQPLIDDVNLVSREILTGLPVIRAFCREDSEKERFDKANTALYRTQLFTNRAMVLFFPMIMVIMNIVTVGIVWYGGHNIDAGVMKVGDLMAFISYTMFIVMSFMMLSMIMVMLPRAAVAAGRVLEVITTKSSLSDKPEAALRDEEFLSRMKERDGGRIVFDDVNFRFHDAEEDTLLDVSFTAEPGRTTAIIGGTGSGKSTLVQLVPRLFDVTKGRVTIDGIDVRDVSQHALRSSLGFVPQKGMLFSGTIETNLKYAGEQVTDEDIQRAAEIAQASDFIEEKEEGFKSPVAQSGSNVSGGQRQRLAIARALAERPKIIIFDDSFSALDFKTDANLRRALAQNAGDSTILIVAQRLATILRADKIIVLDEGRIVGEGTHRELMQTCEVYQDIARSQLSEEELCA